MGKHDPMRGGNSGHGLMGTGLVLILVGAVLTAVRVGSIPSPALVMVIGLGFFLAGLARSAGGG